MRRIVFCSDPTWNRKSVDKSVTSYDEAAEPAVSDSDDEDDGAQQWTAVPRGVRRADSLEGPYSLLSLPLPTDAPDRSKLSSSSPVAASSATASRSSQSLDQRVDELLAKGKLGDGMSTPSSASDHQSDVEESDSLSEDELDIIRLRKPMAVTLQPTTSKPFTTPVPKSSDPQADGEETLSDQPSAEDAASLSDDLVDQIVRMKPMVARAARRPPEHTTASNSPQDLSSKSHTSLPVDLSSKAPGSAKAPPTSSKAVLSFVPTVCRSGNIAASGVLRLSSLPLSTQGFRPGQLMDRVRGGPATAPISPSLALSGVTQVRTEAIDTHPENVSSLISPSRILTVPSVASVAQCVASSGTASAVITSSAYSESGCQGNAADQHTTDTEHSAVSRYQYFVSFVTDISK